MIELPEAVVLAKQTTRLWSAGRSGRLLPTKLRTNSPGIQVIRQTITSGPMAKPSRAQMHTGIGSTRVAGTPNLTCSAARVVIKPS